MVKKKLDQIVYEFIVNQIERGDLLQREHITEQNIADTLEISRTPVRKAFDRLVYDNYLENIENVGVRVKMQSLTPTAFQERIDLFERLVNHYLFDLEKVEVAFEVETLWMMIKNMKSEMDDTAYAFEKQEYDYWLETLKYSDNYYSKKVLMQTLKECLFDDGEIYSIMRKSRALKITHYQALAEYLKEMNYPRARREIRILLNQLKLNVLEKGKFY